MSFMNLYTSPGPWIVAETNNGTEVIEADLIAKNMAEGDSVPLDRISQYLEGKPISAEVKYGFCARYSAPGYLDRTDWCGPYETSGEAIEACKELYGEGEDEDEDEESAA